MRGNLRWSQSSLISAINFELREKSGKFYEKSIRQTRIDLTLYLIVKVWIIVICLEKSLINNRFLKPAGLMINSLLHRLVNRRESIIPLNPHNPEPFKKFLQLLSSSFLVRWQSNYDSIQIKRNFDPRCDLIILVISWLSVRQKISIESSLHMFCETLKQLRESHWEKQWKFLIGKLRSDSWSAFIF